MSNQGGIGKKYKTIEEVKKKMEQLCLKLGEDYMILISPYEDYYRKPSIGMYLYLKSLFSTQLNEFDSFFCGDMGGRKHDKSSSDAFFARNCGLRYYYPESVFQCRSLLPSSPDRIPAYSIDFSRIPVRTISETISLVQKESLREIVLLVGPPASGKSTLTSSVFKEYGRINQDELKTVGRCKKKAESELKMKHSIVIDNTNRTREVRKMWIALAQQHSIPIRCIYMEVEKAIVLHLNTYRSLGVDGERRKVANVAIHSYYKQLEVPNEKEGFSKVIILPFAIKEFSTAEQRQLFYCSLNG